MCWMGPSKGHVHGFDGFEQVNNRYGGVNGKTLMMSTSEDGVVRAAILRWQEGRLAIIFGQCIGLSW